MVRCSCRVIYFNNINSNCNDLCKAMAYCHFWGEMTWYLSGWGFISFEIRLQWNAKQRGRWKLGIYCYGQRCHGSEVGENYSKKEEVGLKIKPETRDFWELSWVRWKIDDNVLFLCFRNSNVQISLLLLLIYYWLNLVNGKLYMMMIIFIQMSSSS